MPQGLGTDLTMFGAPGRSIIDFCRDAAGGCKCFFKLCHLFYRHEVILGSRQNKHIALDPFGDASERIFLQCYHHFKRMLGAQRLHAVADGPSETRRQRHLDPNYTINDGRKSVVV
jgi:hypothetical protein